MKTYIPQEQKQPIQLDILQSQLYTKPPQPEQNQEFLLQFIKLYQQYQELQNLNQIKNITTCYQGKQEEEKKQEERNIQVKTEVNNIIIQNNSQIKKEYDECNSNEQTNISFEPFTLPTQDSTQTYFNNSNNNSNNTTLIQNNTKLLIKDGVKTDIKAFPNINYSGFTFPPSIMSSNSSFTLQNSKIQALQKLKNNTANKNSIINNYLSSLTSLRDSSSNNNNNNNNRLQINGKILDDNSAFVLQQQQQLQKQSSFSQNPFNILVKQETKQEQIQNGSFLLSSNQSIKQEQECENSESNMQEEKSDEKKNDPKETHNIIQQVIPLFIDRFQARCKDIPLKDSFRQLLSKRSSTKSLQYFNEICKVIQQETLHNNLPLMEIAYQIFEYDLAQWARNSKNIETACLYFKYQSAFILILKNPCKFSSIKVARKAHSQKMEKFLGKC
ncbi:hypothetical protein ABPG74_021666 [Tetrahymena malaccensis]